MCPFMSVCTCAGEDVDAGDDDFAFDGKVGEKKNITVRHSARAPCWWMHRSDRRLCSHASHTL